VAPEDSAELDMEVAPEDMAVLVDAQEVAKAQVRMGSLVVWDPARIALLAVLDVEAEVAMVRSRTWERGREVTPRRPLINTSGMEVILADPREISHALLQAAVF